MRVLICTYTFPPSGGPRSIRWVQFADYLSRRGWDVDILTVRPLPKSPRYDEESLKGIPAQVVVHRTFPGIMYSLTYRYITKGAPQPGKGGKAKASRKSAARKLLYKVEEVARSLLIPDGAIEWLPFAVARGRALAGKNRYDALVSVGYPYACHVIGSVLSRYIKGPWIADYGDPWSFFPHFLPPWRENIDRRFEGWLLKRMDRLIVTTEETKAGYLSHFPFLRPEKVEVIPQGYSREQFDAVVPESSKGFRIVYTGIFYGKIREPFTFFKAVADLADIDIEVVIAGRVEDPYRDYVRKMGLDDRITFTGYVSHERAVALQKGATLLLLLGNLSRYQLPSKVYEYLASQRPILSVRYQEEDIASRMVERYRRGLVVENDTERLKSAIRELYSDWQEGRLEGRFKLNEVEEYAWDTIDVRFESMLKKMCREGRR